MFQHDVEKLDWSVVLMSNDVESTAALFHDILCATVDQHAPHMRVKLYVNAPKWITLDYLSHIKREKVLQQKAQKMSV